MNTPNHHHLELRNDRFGRTWECSCGLWTLRADYGWTHTPDGRHARPVPAITPGDATNLHHHHVHFSQNYIGMRDDLGLHPSPEITRHRPAMPGL